MKKLIIALFIMLTTFAQADEIQIPGGCYPKVIQERFAEQGIKLDLSGNDRTEGSWGFIDNKGTYFSIITYKTLTRYDFDIISRILLGDEYGTKE